MLYIPRVIMRYRLRSVVEKAYLKLRMVVEPKTLNPESPGNLHFMRSDARDYIGPIIYKLKRANMIPPETITTDEDSLGTWFEYLQKVRIQLRSPWDPKGMLR